MGTLIAASHSASLPRSIVFVDEDRFDSLVKQLKRKNIQNLPLGDRTVAVGLALAGTPYENYTLELDDRIEAASVNMRGMDCWTLFEIALGTARAFSLTPNPTADDLLKMIELDRYRGGRCTGRFDSRLHHLEDWSRDNERRGLVEDITPRIPGAVHVKRNMEYMGTKWKNFRQLKADPSMIPFFKKLERDLSQRGIYYVPKSKVKSIEKYLRNGDVISIVTNWHGTYTSHVGLAVKQRDGRVRFLHASRDERKVILDETITDYLYRYSKHAGIMVARPKDVRR
ncbi:MAG: N-acetylmuramoyl-L-alanine amidase-like domain-containing protein [Chthoniobacterales bacterium]